MVLFALAVVLSLLGLTAGALLVAIGRRGHARTDAIDGLVSGVVPAIVAARLVPHLYDEIGLLAPALAVSGYLVLGWLEGRRAHAATVGSAFVLPALTVHSMFDGAALAVAFAERRDVAALMLGGALVAHKLPEGLFVGSLYVPRVGVGGTLRRIGWLAAGLIVGAVGGRSAFLKAPGTWLLAFVALGLGIMVHLVVHRHHSPESSGQGPRPESATPVERAAARLRGAPSTALGFAAGVGLALGVPFSGDALSLPRALFGLAAAGLSAAALARLASRREGDHRAVATRDSPVRPLHDAHEAQRPRR